MDDYPILDPYEPEWMQDVHVAAYGKRWVQPKNAPLIFRPESTPLFSTTSAHSFHLDGARWHNIDHYMLTAYSYAGTPLEEELRCAPTYVAARLLVKGQEPVRPMLFPDARPYLEKALTAKLNAHPKQREALLATGTRALIEQPPMGSGQITTNDLGCALMTVHKALRRSATQKAVWKARKTAVQANPDAPTDLNLEMPGE